MQKNVKLVLHGPVLSRQLETSGLRVDDDVLQSLVKDVFEVLGDPVSLEGSSVEAYSTVSFHVVFAICRIFSTAFTQTEWQLRRTNPPSSFPEDVARGEEFVRSDLSQFDAMAQLRIRLLHALQPYLDEGSTTTAAASVLLPAEVSTLGKHRSVDPFQVHMTFGGMLMPLEEFAASADGRAEVRALFSHNVGRPSLSEALAVDTGHSEIPFVPVGSSLKAALGLKPLLESHERCIIVVGKRGCGKETLLRHLAANLYSNSPSNGPTLGSWSVTQGTPAMPYSLASTEFVRYACTPQSCANDIVSTLRRYCVLSETSEGRTYRPAKTGRLLLYIKNIDAPAPDKYHVSEVIEWVRQVGCTGTFVDGDLKICKLEQIQLVASVSAKVGDQTCAGQPTISVRLFACLPVVYVEEPSAKEVE